MSHVSYSTTSNSSGTANRPPATLLENWSSRVMFENRGIDVEIVAQSYGKAEAFTIEVKGTVGDDWPTVLRQMHAGKVRYLFLEAYTGVGVTMEQFIDIFEASGRTVIFKSDVDEQHRRLTRAKSIALLDDDPF